MLFLTMFQDWKRSQEIAWSGLLPLPRSCMFKLSVMVRCSSITRSLSLSQCFVLFKLCCQDISNQNLSGIKTHSFPPIPKTYSSKNPWELSLSDLLLVSSPSPSSSKMSACPSQTSNAFHSLNLYLLWLTHTLCWNTANKTVHSA